MASKKQRIRIESINDGISVYDYSAGPNQFFDAIGIDIDDNRASNSGRGSGPTVISPVQPLAVTSTALTGVPLWIKGNPKDGDFYMYDMNGSVYTLANEISSVTGLGDLNDGGGSRGNGMAYYDNYMYFARNTTVARYGPLNGTPAFTDDYWITTLGKAALEDQSTPTRNSGYTDAKYPNHVMHRHKDGALYFADTLAGQAVIHKIKTSKTAVEGDTDNGSTFNALDLPYGYVVTDIESLGNDLVISAFEAKSILNADGSYNSALTNEGRSALFFWDTTSDSYYKVIQDEFPDQIISALENANGVLYTFSANISFEPTGVRVCRYLGGESFEQITQLTNADLPFAGGTLARLNQILFASTNTNSYPRATVWSIGSQNQPLSNAVFNVVGSRSSTSAGHAICQNDGGAPWATGIFWSYASDNTSATIEEFGSNSSSWDTDLSNGPHAYWTSNWYTIGSRFKITKIKLFATDTNIGSGTDIRVGVVKDQKGSTFNFDSITANSHPNGAAIILKPNGLIAEHSFQIFIEWWGTRASTIALPIEIEYEIINDD